MLFFAPEDERDEDHEEEEDADLDDENSDEEEEGDDEGDDLDDLDDDSDEDQDEDDEEDDDDKPVTRKELRDALKSNKNNRNARRRVSSKKRVTKQSPETETRLDALEKSETERKLLDKKLDFASENGLSKRQVNYVFKQTKRPTAKFLQKPHVKAALDAIKSQENVSRNTPSGSGRSYKAPGGKKWTELSSEERQTNFADRRASILASKKQ